MIVELQANLITFAKYKNKQTNRMSIKTTRYIKWLKVFKNARNLDLNKRLIIETFHQEGEAFV